VHQYQHQKVLVPETAAQMHPENHGGYFVAQQLEFAEEGHLLWLETSAAEFE
jgi:hypothetical protein